MPARDAAPVLGTEEFQSLRALVREQSGIQLSDDSRTAVERRLGERVVALGLRSFGDYYRYLRQHARGSAELDLAVELLATNETYFFRELQQLRAFERTLLPELRERVEVRRSLTVWSAGCSTGEEAYSIAILIDSSGLFTGVNVRVIGSDISRRVLTAARKGVYRGSSFRAMPSQYERYFTPDGDALTVVPQIRGMCQFTQLNLLEEDRALLLGRVDVIFCRNVLIYFDAEVRRAVIRTFFERLHPGGYLLLGHSESLLHVTTEFEVVTLDGTLAYRKPDGMSSQGGRR